MTDGLNVRKSFIRSSGGTVMVLRVERFRTWADLVNAALEYEKKDVRTEVKGWDDIRANKLTVYGDFEEE